MIHPVLSSFNPLLTFRVLLHVLHDSCPACLCVIPFINSTALQGYAPGASTCVAEFLKIPWLKVHLPGLKLPHARNYRFNRCLSRWHYDSAISSIAAYSLADCHLDAVSCFLTPSLIFREAPDAPHHVNAVAIPNDKLGRLHVDAKVHSCLPVGQYLLSLARGLHEVYLFTKRNNHGLQTMPCDELVSCTTAFKYFVAAKYLCGVYHHPSENRAVSFQSILQHRLDMILHSDKLASPSSYCSFHFWRPQSQLCVQLRTGLLTATVSALRPTAMESTKATIAGSPSDFTVILTPA